MAIDSKLTNVLGVKMPYWIINQLDTRAQMGAMDQRSNENLKFITNKTAWVRLVSSVNVSGSADLDYFKRIDPEVRNQDDLAKRYMLFGGTSIYLKEQSYQLRSGFHNIGQTGGAYGMLGESEVQNYGYRPMPGIARVNIDTQGRLGSIRQAVIDIKCWDKAQLDIIDALYFKLGYSMFLEWGHTYYYPNDSSTLQSSEFMSIDPFQSGLSKEELIRRISVNSRRSSGNYDAMLGMVTNFTFAYNADGGYDCTLRLMGLGVLGDSLRINNPSKLINLLTDEILLLNKTLQVANPGFANPTDQLIKDLEAEKKALEENQQREIANYTNKLDEIKKINAYNIPLRVTLKTQGFEQPDYKKFNFIGDLGSTFGSAVYISRLEEFFPLKPDLANKTNVVLNSTRILDFITNLKKVRLEAGLGTNEVGEKAIKLGGNSKYSYVKRYYDWIKIGLDDELSKFFIQSEIPKPDVVNEAYGMMYGFNYTVRKVFGVDYDGIDVAYKKYSPEKYIFQLYTSFNFSEVNELSKNDLKSEALNKIKETNPSLIDKDSKANYQFTYPTITQQTPDSNYNTVNLKLDTYGDINSYIEKKIGYWDTEEADFFNQNFQIVHIRTVPSVEIWDPKAVGKRIFTQKIEFTVRGILKVEQVPVKVSVTNLFNKDNGNFTSQAKQAQILVDLDLPIYLRFSDTDFIESFDLSGIQGYPVNPLKNKRQLEEQLKEQKKLLAQQQKDAKDALVAQISDALGMQSNLEISLRTIQIRALNSAFYQSGATPDLDIGNKIYEFKLTTPTKSQNIQKSLAQTVFSNGLYDWMIDDLISGNITDDPSSYISDEKARMKMNAKYGFATTLMGSDSENDKIFEGLKKTDYESLLRAFVVPYRYSANLVEGIEVNHPVYVPFGLLLMLINHSCTLYESQQSDLKSDKEKDNKSRAFQKPLVYVDYNTELNLFQTCPQQMSTNPWVTLMRVECNKEEYAKIFNPNVLDTKKEKIKKISNKEGANEQTTGEAKLFNPEKDDLLSFRLPKIKIGNNYAGKIMNILLNVDYVVELVKQNSFKDGSNGVFLKPFLENLLTDVNKYLGNFNAFRLNYSDKANTFQIVDDQYVYTDLDVPVSATPVTNPENRTEIPLVGRYSIAKSLELKTEMGSKLANLIAISANATTEQAQNSTNADSVGYINANYVDRIIPSRVSSGGSESSINGEIAASQQFNKTIEDFYSTIEPSKNDVSQATAFLIEKISSVKNETAATRATAIIPLGINFTTDGISGMSMYQTYTVSNEILPYTYYSKKINSLIDNQTTYVGFVVVGLTHTIEGNTWTTAVRSNMISVKDKTEFVGKITEPSNTSDSFKSSVNAPPRSTVVPNGDSLRAKIAEINKANNNRITISGNRITSYADITSTMAKETGDLFEAAIKKFSDLKIYVGGGNDEFHVKLLLEGKGISPHTQGRGLDFTVGAPYAIGEDVNEVNANHDKLSAFFVEWKNSHPNFYIILDEYRKPSANSTGGHYHITMKS